jgi:adenosine deaminase CECR1
MKQFWKQLIAFMVGLGLVCGATLGESLLIPVISKQIAAQNAVSLQASTNFAKIRRDKTQLRAFLQKMPKGAELHTHLSGSITPKRLLELAAQSKQYRYFVRIPKGNFAPDDANAYKFVALPANSAVPEDANATLVPVAKLLKPQTEIERRQYVVYRSAQMIAENEPNPNNVFFNAVFARGDAVTGNPEIIRQMLADKVKEASQHHLNYIEFMLSPFPNTPVGASKSEEYKVINITSAREHLSKLIDAVQTANQKLPENERVEVRFMLSFRRTSSRLFTQLPIAFELAAANDAVGNAIAGINLVGNEYSEDVQIGQEIAAPSAVDDYILTLRRIYPAVHLSIHAGERTKWDWHIRDSILLGAERIGHAVNLEASPQLNAPEVGLMRRRGILIEACPISNNLLLKIPLAKHPFLKWLRMGIPVSLNTDDAGIFGSDITEEFARAVEAHPDISWDELKQLALNSLEHAFVEDSTKAKLIQNWQTQIAAFETANIP